jgi:serine/threonine-protein kinase RsbW
MSADTRAVLLLESRYENIEVAERVLIDVLAAADGEGEDEYWMVTALREAVANAVQHGSGGDPARRVEVVYHVEGNELVITIRDTGEGFDPAGVPDPTDPENLLRPCGRGIFYMRRFMDSVDFDTQPGRGTIVTMSKKLNAGRDKGDAP